VHAKPAEVFKTAVNNRITLEVGNDFIACHDTGDNFHRGWSLFMITGSFIFGSRPGIVLPENSTEITSNFVSHMPLYAHTLKHICLQFMRHLRLACPIA
jgi:hypothetical protein